MKKDPHRDLQHPLHLGNVMPIAKRLLNTDICACLVKHDSKFALEVKHLCDLLHRYRYATAQDRPQGFSTIEWVEQLGKELVQQTQHCLEQLTDTIQQELLYSTAFQTNVPDPLFPTTS